MARSNARHNQARAPRGGGYGRDVGARGAGLRTAQALASVRNDALGRLKPRIKADAFAATIKPLQLAALDDFTAWLVTDDPMVRDMASDGYAEQLAWAFSAACERPMLVDIRLAASNGAGEGSAPAPTPARALWYLPSPFVQVSAIPASPQVMEWRAHQGHTLVEAKAAGELPFGAVGRKVLCALTTAVTQARIFTTGLAQPVEIAPSLSAFIREVAGSDTGGTKGTRAGVIRQLEAVLRSTWTITEGEAVRTVRLFEEGEAAAVPAARQPLVLTPTAEAIEAFRGRLVPLARETIQALGRDTVAIDLYAWGTWRSTTSSSKRPIYLTHNSTAEQLGRRWRHVAAWMLRVGDAATRVARLYKGLKASVVWIQGHRHRAAIIRLSEPDVAQAAGAIDTGAWAPGEGSPGHAPAQPTGPPA